VGHLGEDHDVQSDDQEQSGLNRLVMLGQSGIDRLQLLMLGEFVAVLVASPCTLGNLPHRFPLCDLLPSGRRRGSFFVKSGLTGSAGNGMEISWDDVNRTESTGPHFVTRLGIDVFITEGAIARWKVDPECHHKVFHISTSRGNIYSLGSCEPFQED
jgi:hypothetical protein